eukprot:GDKJ01008116.1.p2 GENE.GDKJ01008116.1~~GDKJ01008116.1.p2  ORF type:complete len:158 (+),score=12.70 GDKJ01008116.1:352-825(+)
MVAEVVESVGWLTGCDACDDGGTGNGIASLGACVGIMWKGIDCESGDGGGAAWVVVYLTLSFTFVGGCGAAWLRWVATGICRGARGWSDSAEDVEEEVVVVEDVDADLVLIEEDASTSNGSSASILSAARESVCDNRFSCNSCILAQMLGGCGSTKW